MKSGVKLRRGVESELNWEPTVDRRTEIELPVVKDGRVSLSGPIS
jgi:hypothetical protein